MSDIIHEPTATPEPIGDTPPSREIPADDAPLSAHIDAFHAPEKTEPEESPAQVEKKKHRSAKNEATARDVPRIRELTRERDEWKSKYEAATRQQPSPTPAREPIARPSQPPAEKFTYPGYDAYLTDHPEASYEDYQDDRADARRAWQQAKDQHAQAEAQTVAQRQQQQQAIQARHQTYSQQLDAYLQEHPDRLTAFQNLPEVENPLVLESIWRMDDPPDIVYTLRQQPALFDELLLLTDGKPVSAQHVASVTNWLRTRVQGGATGAPARVSSPTPPAPRPPTPVRTTPMPPPEAPPGDSSSLSEHQAFYRTAR